MKFSQVATKSTPAATDYLMGVDAANADFRMTMANILLYMSQNFTIATKFRAYLNTALAAHTNFAIVKYDTVSYGSGYSTSTGEYTAPVAGYYHFDAVIGGPVNNGGTSNATLYKNGTLAVQGSALTSYIPGAQNPFYSNVSGDIFLAAGDKITVRWGTNIATSYNGTAVCFSGHLISL